MSEKKNYVEIKAATALDCKVIFDDEDLKKKYDNLDYGEYSNDSYKNVHFNKDHICY